MLVLIRLIWVAVDREYRGKAYAGGTDAAPKYVRMPSTDATVTTRASLETNTEISGKTARALYVILVLISAVGGVAYTGATNGKCGFGRTQDTDATDTTPGYGAVSYPGAVCTTRASSEANSQDSGKTALAL